MERFARKVYVHVKLLNNRSRTHKTRVVLRTQDCFETLLYGKIATTLTYHFREQKKDEIKNDLSQPLNHLQAVNVRPSLCGVMISDFSNYVSPSLPLYDQHVPGLQYAL